MPSRFYYHHFIILLVFCSSTVLFSQEIENITYYGRVSDEISFKPIDYVSVFIEGTNYVTETDLGGKFKLKVPVSVNGKLIFSRIGYKKAQIELPLIKNEKFHKFNVLLAPIESDIGVIVKESKIEDLGMIKEDVEEFDALPTTTGNIESILTHIALGTSSGTGGELTSQYNVRGGNYDENLVYVNGFEIYRPQLISSGRQEGLTLPNPDLIRDLSFSSGGFEAKYGDKMSSVLDIKYKTPDVFKASASLSALGASAHMEQAFALKKGQQKNLSILLGVRYKTTKYLLGSLETTGEYTPSFIDLQSYISYALNSDFSISYLANYNKSNYSFIPESRSTSFGRLDFTLRLTTLFEGQESDDFLTFVNGVSLNYLPQDSELPLSMKLQFSNTIIKENERYDILGQYSLSQISTGLNEEDQGKELQLLGLGIDHQYVRNLLNTNVSNIKYSGAISFEFDPKDDVVTSHLLKWGMNTKIEIINDRINEWQRLDSAGYSLPYDESKVNVFTVYKSENQLQSSKYTAYIEDKYERFKEDKYEMEITYGLRSSYWTLNKEFLWSPRAQLLYHPLNWNKEISFKLASGYYHQPAFYREMRRIDGSLNTNIKAQKSFHIVGGMTYDFDWKKVSNKPFRLITELYYKSLWDLVSYDLENVRIRYNGQNDAMGYVMGWDTRLNGEFVPGAESWINISFLRSREKLNGIQHKDVKLQSGENVKFNKKDVPRPTDQFMSLSMFFQDYLPQNNNAKMHMKLIIGTGLPYGLKGNNKIFRNHFRYKPYHRIDIGFSYLMWTNKWLERKPRHPLRFSKNAWISLEIYNLLAIKNEATRTWIKTTFGNQFAVPSHLTSRRINLKIKMDF